MRKLPTVCAAMLVLGALYLMFSPAWGQPKPGGAKEPEITMEVLKEWLDQLGYEFKENRYKTKVKDTDGKETEQEVMGGYLVPMSRVGASGLSWNFDIAIAFSGNKQFIWVHQGFGVIKNIPQGILLKMLNANSQMGPLRFEIFDNDFVRLSGGFPVKGFNRVLLRSQIEALANSAALTDKLWWPKNWANQGSAKTGAAHPDQAGNRALPTASRLHTGLLPAASNASAAPTSTTRSQPTPGGKGQPVTKEFYPFNPEQRPPAEAVSTSASSLPGRLAGNPDAALNRSLRAPVPK